MIEYSECRHCIYYPCGKDWNEQIYCLVRLLIIEVERKRRLKDEID